VREGGGVHGPKLNVSMVVPVFLPKAYYMFAGGHAGGQRHRWAERKRKRDGESREGGV